MIKEWVYKSKVFSDVFKFAIFGDPYTTDEVQVTPHTTDVIDVGAPVMKTGKLFAITDDVADIIGLTAEPLNPGATVVGFPVIRRGVGYNRHMVTWPAGTTEAIKTSADEHFKTLTIIPLEGDSEFYPFSQ